ncbi:hypothetical protein EDD85DRAFT_500220 [Armillaria nabsnona]|nr:hypothetical protein EDD85DRAFT_500220 [Armillaria nabsnona]
MGRPRRCDWRQCDLRFLFGCALSRNEAVGIEGTGLPLSVYANYHDFWHLGPMSLSARRTLGCYTFLPRHPFPEVSSNFAPTFCSGDHDVKVCISQAVAQVFGGLDYRQPCSESRPSTLHKLTANQAALGGVASEHFRIVVAWLFSKVDWGRHWNLEEELAWVRGMSSGLHCRMFLISLREGLSESLMASK